MCHINRNKLLSLYYNEVTEKEEKVIRIHLNSCNDCKTYVKTINQTELLLDHWPNEEPITNSFNEILARIPSTQPKAQRRILARLLSPIIQLVLSLIFISSAVYLLYSTLKTFAIWTSLENYWIYHLIGNFGIITLLFFCVSIFFTLCMTPILLFESQNSEINTRQRSI